MNGIQSLTRKARKPRAPKYAAGGITKLVPRYDAGGTPGTQYVSNIPAFAEQPMRDLVQSTVDTIQQPTTPYAGDRVATFTPLQEKGFEGVNNLGPSAQSTTAGTLAQTAGDKALATTYDPHSFNNTITGPQQTSTQSFTGAGTADKYMNPYMQSVVDIGKREATRNDDIARTQRNAAAVGAGAFGGSRQAIVEAEANKNLQQHLGDIQQQGSDAAFKAAQAQFNAEQQAGLQSQIANQGAGLTFNQQDLDRQKMEEASRQFGANLGLQGTQAATQAASTLGGIGSDIYGQNLKTTGAQLAAGTAEQEQGQKVLDQQYKDFLDQQQDPYKKLSFLSDILHGTQGSVKTSFTEAPEPSNLQTLTGLGTIFAGLGKAKGGTVRKSAIDRGLARIAPDSAGDFADGGIIGFAEGGKTTKEDFMPEEWNDGTTPATATGGLYTGTKGFNAARRAVQNARDLAKLAESAGHYGTDFQSAFTATKPLGTAARVIGKVAAPVTGALSLADTYRTPTEQYDKRFGLEGREPGFWSDTGVRTLGAASDLGNTLTGGLAGKYLFRDMENDKAPRAAAPAPATKDTAIDTGTIDPSKYSLAGKGAMGGIGVPQVHARAAPTLDEMLAAQKAAGVDYEGEQAQGVKSREDIAAAEKADAEAAAQETKDRIAKAGVLGADREKKLNERLGEFPERQRQNEKDAYINAGLAMLTAPAGGAGWRRAIAPIAAGAGLGLKQYRAGEDELRAQKAKLDDSMDTLLEARRLEGIANDKEIGAAQRAVRTAEITAKKDMTNYMGSMGIAKLQNRSELFNNYEKIKSDERAQGLHADIANATNATHLGAATITANARIGAGGFAGMKPAELERAINGLTDDIMKAPGNFGMSIEQARAAARAYVQRQLQGQDVPPSSTGWGSMKIGN
jgi:hypothetical protein